MMGSKGGVGGPAVVIPAGAWKIVQSLKEIVNCPEQEIYAALKECNMDPNEAVNRLLSQDPFHEVKSKREKKKEVKDTTESRPRSVVASSRAGRTGADRYAGRGRANVLSSTVIADSSKPTSKKENGSYAIPSSSFASPMSGPNINLQVAYSNNFPSEIKAPTIGENDLISSSVQPSPGFQHAWVGNPGQVSMADIVKMGKQQAKSSGVPNHLAHHPVAPGSHDDFQLHDQSSKLYKSKPQITTQHVPSNEDDWPLDEQQVPPPNEDEWPPFENSQDGNHQHVTSRLDGGHISDDGHVDGSTNHMAFASISNRKMPEDEGRDASLYDNNGYKNVNSFQPHMHDLQNGNDYAEDDGVGAVSTNLQHLSLKKNEHDSAPVDDGPAVVIPDHLQVHPSDCQHLSFGSFAPSIGSFPGPAGSRSFRGSFPETQPLPDASSDSHPEIRNPEQYGDEHLRPTSNGDDTCSGVPNGGNYEAASASQPETFQQHPGESAVGTQYPFPSTASEYTHEISQALDSTFGHTQDGSPIQNLASFSNVMPSYTNSLPNALLASAAQTGRESDLSYLPFMVNQSTAAKYSNTAASLNSSLMSTPEGIRAGSVSAAQQPPQSLPAAGLAGLGLPQHLAMHAYSQPMLSLSPFANMANMVGYPFLPQSYSYMPSAFQQAFPSNNTYHQSLAAVPPQYKSSLSAGNLPQSSAVASGYGFDSSTNIPSGNFTLNPQAASTTLGYENALSSQYKDGSSLLSLQQNDNSGMWVSGAAARAAPNVPASTYYNFAGQNQQLGGLRQAQQPSQHFSSLGYPNYYQSSGISLEQQQQLVRDSTLGGPQGQQSKQSAQMWQNTY